MSNIKHIKQAGFTIVELLIVIVVIGILAAITVVSYNGITERARNVARVNAAKQAQQIVQLALADISPTDLRGKLNFSDSWWRACVGKDYEDVNGDGEGDCASFTHSSGSLIPYASTSSNFDAVLEESASLPSMRSYPAVKSADGDVVTGPYFGSAWVDSTDMLVVEYILEGEDHDCGLSPLVYKSGSAYSMTPTGSPNYTVNGEGTTECMIAVVEHM